MVLLQVIEQVAKRKAIALTFLTPDKLRQALKAAHYVVKPSECDEILAYAVSDGNLSGMDQLHLLRLCDDSIGQILSYGTPSTTSSSRQTKACQSRSKLRLPNQVHCPGKVTEARRASLSDL